MRKYLLSETGNFYKANLHCHTNISDGRKTPQEIKELYLKKGYSIVAYTDHDIFLSHNDLTDERFLALNGFEVEIMNWYGRHPLRNLKVCHLCYIALDKDIVTHPVWHREKYLWGNAKQYREEQQFDENQKDYMRSYTPSCINDMMAIGRERGFFVTLNHLSWSRESYDCYSQYHGMHAMEIMNGTGICMGYDDYNSSEYDAILRTGKKLYCIGADDNHNTKPDDSRYCDSGWAWTVIKAEKLDYPSVAEALTNGNFYASEGPEIYELYIEDDKIHIKCSPADHIFCTYEKRGAGSVLAENGELVTEATFNVYPELGYFRVTVKDKYGKYAYTNAYFPEEFLEDMKDV